jgi:dTDP-4-dehydrorhamnose reductase
MKILVLGSTGVVGHAIALYFSESCHEVICSDDTSKDSIKRLLDEADFDAIINCTAIVNQAAEEDKAGASYLNAYLPHMLEQLTTGTKTIVVHRSTDCIFSGAKGQYTLDDWPDAKSFYARTKAVGELNNDKDITIRVSLIGPAQEKEDGSLLNWFLNQKGEVKGFANAIWTGLTTLEYAKTIEGLLKQKAHGLFQAAPNVPISKYELIKLFEEYFPGERTIVKVDNNRVDKSLVPCWGDYDIHINGYKEQIAEMKNWIDKHPGLYPAYYYENKQ